MLFRNFCTPSKPSCKAVMFCSKVCGGTRRTYKFKYVRHLKYENI